MAEMLDESTNLESQTVNIYRTAATVKGGRRFSFGALVVVGDKRGKVGYGYAKSKEVPLAIEKAQKVARREMTKLPAIGTTVPHEVEGRFSASKVRLIPASPGTGVVAGATVRAVLEMAGITDCLTKCYGSTNKLNVVKAVFDGIEQLRMREDVAELRGVEITTTDIEERVERGQRFMPKTTGEKMRGPTNTIGQDRRGGGRGGHRGGGRGGPGGGRGRGGGPRDGAPQQDAQPSGRTDAPKPAPAAPAAPAEPAPAEGGGDS
ncbi:MAG: 30S ribosomal protein S5 [Planctomycetota bacterium]